MDAIPVPFSSLRKLTLVLGAGSSVAMGYPTGPQLRERIINTHQSYAKLVYESSQIHERELNNFVDQFQKSQMVSIDAFLARRPEFATIGKHVIASMIIGHEKKERLHTPQDADKWHQYFFKAITTDTWDELKLDTISIISFNYDRSFEHYVIQALMASYGKRFDECYRKLHEMDIIHVYGDIGPNNPDDPDYFPYGKGLKPETISTASSRLKVIPEGRDSDETLLRARAILESSRQIAFMGFGYDEINLQRLDVARTCTQTILTTKGNILRKIIGTRLDMTDSEISRAIKIIFAKHPAAMRGHIDNFYNMNCLQMLRETSIIQ